MNASNSGQRQKIIIAVVIGVVLIVGGIVAYYMMNQDEPDLNGGPGPGPSMSPGPGPSMNPPTPLTDDQAQCYLDRYTDLRDAFEATNITAAKSHWITTGIDEGRDASCPVDDPAPDPDEPEDPTENYRIMPSLDYTYIR